MSDDENQEMHPDLMEWEDTEESREIKKICAEVVNAADLTTLTPKTVSVLLCMCVHV